MNVARALVLAICVVTSGAYSSGTNFLLISAPINCKVGYVPLPDAGPTALQTPLTLIDQGLQHPQGLAVDQRRQRLYVADPTAKKVFSYTYTVNGDRLSISGEQGIAASGVAARWVAVDGVGNIFFSNEDDSQIMKVPAANALRGSTTSEVVYDGASVPALKSPGGVAVDNFHVFWANKQTGNEQGSVVRAAEAPVTPSAIDSVAPLSKNEVVSYGVCLALGNVFYTGRANKLYGVKKSGGDVVTISQTLDKPRGCAWDGDGTVFVADRGTNAVYSFAGNMHTLAPVTLTKIASFDGAFGLATISIAAAPRVVLALLAAVVATGFGM